MYRFSLFPLAGLDKRDSQFYQRALAYACIGLVQDFQVGCTAGAAAQYIQPFAGNMCR